MSYMHDIIVDSTPDYDTGTEFIKAQMLHRIEEEYIMRFVRNLLIGIDHGL